MEEISLYTVITLKMFMVRTSAVLHQDMMHLGSLESTQEA